MLRSQWARREAAVVWRRCMMTDAQEPDMGFAFRRPPSVQDKTISRQATYQEHELIMEPSRHTATVRAWRLINGMTEALAVVRYIEQHYGEVHEFKFQKDCEMPYLYTTQLSLTFKQRHSLELLGKGAIVKVPSAPLSSFPPPHLLSLADIQSAAQSADTLSPSASATSPPENVFDGVITRPGQPEDDFLELTITPNAPRTLRAFVKRDVAPVISSINAWNGFGSEEDQGQAMELARMRWARFSSRRPIGSTMMPRATSVVGEAEMDEYGSSQDLPQPGEYRRSPGVRTRRSPRVEAAPPVAEEVASAPQTESIESTLDTATIESIPQSETVASMSESETITSAPISEAVASTPQVETTLKTTPEVDSAVTGTLAAIEAAPITKATPPKPRSSAAAPQRPRRSPHVEAAKAQEKSVLTMIKKKEARGTDTRSARPQSAKAPKKATPDVLVKARQEQKQAQQKQKQQQPQKQKQPQDQTLVTKLKGSLFGNWFK